jgi:hypothetical protein
MNLGQRKREVLRIHKENKQIVGRLQNIKSEFERLKQRRPKTTQTGKKSRQRSKIIVLGEKLNVMNRS